MKMYNYKNSNGGLRVIFIYFYTYFDKNHDIFVSKRKGITLFYPEFPPQRLHLRFSCTNLKNIHSPTEAKKTSTVSKALKMKAPNSGGNQNKIIKGL